MDPTSSQEAKSDGGYNCNWVEDPPSEVTCPICLCVARDPHQHPGDSENECGKIFCHGCITKSQEENEKCPNCQRNLKIFKDSKSARQIRALKVKCDNLDNGCEWAGQLGELETHLQSCDHAYVPCSNKCKVPDSTEIRMILAKDVPHHLAEECPRREHKCPLCSQVGEYEQMADHMEKCPRVRVSCSNFPCAAKLLHCDVESHRSVCEYEPVSCKYIDVGCWERPLRKDLEEHEEDAPLHLWITTERVLDLTKKVAKLTSRSAFVPVRIRLNDFQRHKDDKSGFYSSPFYVPSRAGYKMCVSGFVCGNVGSEGTHVSAYVHLMKGDNDDSLTWPFTGSVIIELLNQLEDKNHYKKLFEFPDCCKRVVNGERGDGWGYVQFITHTELDYNFDKNCQYLKDDSIFFQISVKVRGYKPWLDCTV